MDERTTMPAAQSYMTSALSGSHKLTKALERLKESGCEKCGHLPAMGKESAKELDGLVWTALRFAEGRQ